MVATATGVHRGVHLNNTVKLPDLENMGVDKQSAQLHLRGPSYTALKSL